MKIRVFLVVPLLAALVGCSKPDAPLPVRAEVEVRIERTNSHAYTPLVARHPSTEPAPGPFLRERRMYADVMRTNAWANIEPNGPETDEEYLARETALLQMRDTEEWMQHVLAGTTHLKVQIEKHRALHLREIEEIFKMPIAEYRKMREEQIEKDMLEHRRRDEAEPLLTPEQREQHLAFLLKNEKEELEKFLDPYWEMERNGEKFEEDMSEPPIVGILKEGDLGIEDATPTPTP